MSDIKVRVGQQNTVKILSSLAGGSAFAENARNAENVIGGIASVTQLNVSGISTFVGLSTFNNNVYIGGDLYVSDNITSDEIFSRNINITGIGTIPTLISTNANLDYISAINLNVSGISTFVGITTFNNNVYIGGDLYVSDDIFFDEFTSRNANITGILTVAQSIYYPPGEPFGVAYFDNNDQLVSTGTTSSAISETNYILSTNSSGVPSWSNVIDGGEY